MHLYAVAHTHTQEYWTEQTNVWVGRRITHSMAVSRTTSAAPDNLTVCVHYFLVQQDRVSVAITLRNALQLGAHVSGRL